jgi:hypothetical protein
MSERFTELGKTGLHESRGRIFQDFLRELRFIGTDKGGFGVYEEMRLNSPVITALLNAINQSVLSVDWMFTSEEGEDDPRLELLRDSEMNMTHTLKSHIEEALTMLPFGYSLFEIVYERVDSRILWGKIAFRGQDTIQEWKIDEHGGIQGVTQRTTNSFSTSGTPTVDIPIEKMVLYRVNVERNNPEGRSILRGARIPYYYATHLQEIEAIGIERDLTGLPMITPPENADMSSGSTDRSEAEQIVRRVRNDEQAGVVLPSGEWTFELLSSPGSKQIDTGAVISRHEKRILMSALAQFLVLGMDQIGALSLSEDQTDFFNMAVNTTADIIANTFTKHVVPKLMAFNGFNAEGLKVQNTIAGDTNALDWFTALEKAGDRITWTSEDEVVARDIQGLPEKSVEELEELREAEAERAAEMLQRIGGAQQNNNEEEDEFGATSHPTDKERDAQEAGWFSKLMGSFRKTRKRLKKESEEFFDN